jgi:hypothetical protein
MKAKNNYIPTYLKELPPQKNFPFEKLKHHDLLRTLVNNGV